MPCNESSRRTFLHECGILALAGAALGLSEGTLRALPRTSTEGEERGSDRRYPIPAEDGVNIDRRAQVILVRFEGQVFAFALSCPHQNAAVKWVKKAGRFQCTKHDSQYTPAGVYSEGRATRNMDRFPIRRDGDSVLVDVSQVYHSDDNPTGWAAAAVAI